MTTKELSEKTGFSGPRLTTWAKEGVLKAKKVNNAPFPPMWDFDESAVAVCEAMNEKAKGRGRKKGQAGGMVITGQDFVSEQEIPLVKD